MFPELNTNRLIRKQTTANDQQFIFEGLSHPEVIPFYGVQFDSFEHTKVQMDWYDNILKEASGIPWKIIDKETLKQVGVVSIYYYKANHNKAELGFWLLPGFWNKGIASE